jgi:hypothetical protein
MGVARCAGSSKTYNPITSPCPPPASWGFHPATSIDLTKVEMNPPLASQ